MAVSKLNPSAGGIPFGNTAGRPTPATGKLYSNGETARVELYTQAGAWENIVQEVPGVASITGAYNESTGSATIVIQGTNFVSGGIASAIGTNGVEVLASSTTFNSLVQLTATFTGLSNAYEPYDIKVTNPSNLFGLLPDILYVNANPIWQTASGSLGTFNEQVSISVSAIATDDSTITYSLASGSTLPTGVTLNSSTGLISGTLPDIVSNTTYTFTINASDGVNPSVSRSFSIQSIALLAEILVIGGGGSGSTGNGGSGGGGAGGLVYSSSYALLSGTKSITIGQGGASASTGATGSNGANTILGDITAFGGGAGKGWTAGQGSSGGSGGGGGSGTGYGAGGGATTQTSPSGATGYGNIGGTGNPGSNPYSGGGGGGAGGAGGNATASTSVANGGVGLAYSITGTSVYYAGGGGSGTEEGSYTSSGLGGNGGGGRGGYLNTPGVSGTANTGGGGGGGGYPQAAYASGAGGSGVVIIAYPNTFAVPTISGGLTYDQPTRSGYRVYRFTAGSGTVTF